MKAKARQKEFSIRVKTTEKQREKYKVWCIINKTVMNKHLTDYMQRCIDSEPKLSD